jgi:hypothetical protein
MRKENEMKTLSKFFIVATLSVLSSLVISGCGGGGAAGVGGGISYLKVINAAGSSQDIWALYSTPSSSSSWGPDRLGSTVITPGSSRTFNTTNCDINYDLKIVWRDGTAETKMGYYRGCGTTSTFVFTN